MDTDLVLALNDTVLTDMVESDKAETTDLPSNKRVCIDIVVSNKAEIVKIDESSFILSDFVEQEKNKFIKDCYNSYKESNNQVLSSQQDYQNFYSQFDKQCEIVEKISKEFVEVSNVVNNLCNSVVSMEMATVSKFVGYALQESENLKIEKAKLEKKCHDAFIELAAMRLEYDDFKEESKRQNDAKESQLHLLIEQTKDFESEKSFIKESQIQQQLLTAKYEKDRAELQESIANAEKKASILRSQVQQTTQACVDSILQKTGANNVLKRKIEVITLDEDLPNAIDMFLNSPSSKTATTSIDFSDPENFGYSTPVSKESSPMPDSVTPLKPAQTPVVSAEIPSKPAQTPGVTTKIPSKPAETPGVTKSKRRTLPVEKFEVGDFKFGDVDYIDNSANVPESVVDGGEEETLKRAIRKKQARFMGYIWLSKLSNRQRELIKTPRSSYFLIPVYNAYKQHLYEDPTDAEPYKTFSATWYMSNFYDILVAACGFPPVAKKPKKNV